MKKRKIRSGKQFNFPVRFFPRELYIKGRISESLYKRLKEELQILNKNKGAINVFIESEGGDFIPSKKIFEMFLKSRNPIIGIAGEKISSLAAVLVFQACKFRLVKKETKMFLHNIKQTLTFETIPFKTHKKLSHKILDENLKTSEKHQIFIYEVLMETCGKTKKEVAHLFSEDCTLSASQILENGLADKIC